MIFIPERGHLVSISWDKTIKVWRAYRKLNSVKKDVEQDFEKKFETWVWSQMKQAMKDDNTFDSASYSDNLNARFKK